MRPPLRVSGLVYCTTRGPRPACGSTRRTAAVSTASSGPCVPPTPPPGSTCHSRRRFAHAPRTGTSSGTLIAQPGLGPWTDWAHDLPSAPPPPGSCITTRASRPCCCPYQALRTRPRATTGLAHRTTRLQPAGPTWHIALRQRPPSSGALCTAVFLDVTTRGGSLLCCPLPPGHVAALHGALCTPPHPRARSPHNPGPARGSTWRTALHQPRLFWTLCPPTSLSVNPRPPLPPYAAPRARPRTSNGSLSINRGSAGGLAWSTTPDPRGIHWTLCAPTSPPVASRPQGHKLCFARDRYRVIKLGPC